MREIRLQGAVERANAMKARIAAGRLRRPE
jgi:hypothetical protein